MLKVNTVVKSIAGHDKNRFFCLVEITENKVKLVDGKERKLLKPKTKSIKHIEVTQTMLDISIVKTNKKIRSALWPFNYGQSENLAIAKKGGD